MILNTLFFDSVIIDDSDSEITVAPRFICPKCRKYINGKISDNSPKIVLKSWSINKTFMNRETNFNKQVTFTKMGVLR